MTEVETIPCEDIFTKKKEDIFTKKESVVEHFEDVAEEKTKKSKDTTKESVPEASAADMTDTDSYARETVGDISGFHGGEERTYVEEETPSYFKSPFFEMKDEALEEALKNANKNTYWEFGLFTEKKRRSGKLESFVYEEDGPHLYVLPTYTDKGAREVCGEPVAVSFGGLPESTSVNSKGNPNSVRFSTHLEIHFDITEGAETKEGKSVAYMKAQSFLAAAYRGDTLGGKPVRRFRLTNMSEEELKAWGEVRAAFEGQGKKIEFILTDEQQKVFDRYAAKFAEITRLNRELVGDRDYDLSHPENLTNFNIVPEETKNFYARGEELVSLEKLESKPKMEDHPATEEPEAEKTPEELADDELTADPASSLDSVTEEEKDAELDAMAEAVEEGEYKAEPSSETTALAEREPHEVVGADLADWEEAATNEEESNAAANDAIPVTTENKEFVNLPDVSAFFKNMDEVEATAAKEAREKAIREFFENMDKVEANVAVENAINAFFNNMDKVEATAAKENAIRAFFKVMDEIAKASNNSGVSSVVEEQAKKSTKSRKYNLSSEEDLVDARKAFAWKNARSCKDAIEEALETNQGSIRSGVIAESKIREDVAEYHNRYAENAEKIFTTCEETLSLRQIFTRAKKGIGDSRYINEETRKAHEENKFKENMAIKTASGYYKGKSSTKRKRSSGAKNLANIKDKQNER